MQPLLAWWKGATVVLERGFDAARCLELIASKRVTTMMGVPANYLFIAQEPGFASADLSSLRRAVVGGAPMPEALSATGSRAGSRSSRDTGSPRRPPTSSACPRRKPSASRGTRGQGLYVDVTLRDT